MADVTFILEGKIQRKSYTNDKRAYTGIYKWLLKHEAIRDKQAILYSVSRGTDSFDDISNVPYQPPVKSRPSIKGWKTLTVKALSRDGSRCRLCGKTPKDGVKMHVDHIKPVAKYPELADQLDNLQVLCEDCNIGKSDIDLTS